MNIDRERINAKTVMIITLIVAILLITASFLCSVEYQNLQNILISVGCSILASDIIMYFTTELMLRNKRTKEIIDKWGLEAIFETRASMNTSSNRALEKCKKSMEIIAFGLRGFRDAKTEIVKKLIKKGVVIKILTLNPESDMAKLVDEREKQIEGYTKKSIESLVNWARECNESCDGKEGIIIKFYDYIPLDFYFRIDDNVYVGPYLRGKSSQQIISYEFSSGQGGEYWKKYFKDLWNLVDDSETA
jgi:hypothetical protein